MNLQKSVLAGLFVLCLSLACATTTSNMTLQLEGRQVNLRRFLKEQPLAKDHDVRVDLIASGPTASIHVVQLRHAEKPHIHAKHDLRVVLLRGHGTMVIDQKRISVGAGAVFEIRRGTRHYFVNESRMPSAALVTFSPPYDGQDMIPVPE